MRARHPLLQSVRSTVSRRIPSTPLRYPPHFPTPFLPLPPLSSHIRFASTTYPRAFTESSDVELSQAVPPAAPTDTAPILHFLSSLPSDLSEFAPKFTSFPHLLNAPSRSLKVLGLPLKARKSLLHHREIYKEKLRRAEMRQLLSDPSLPPRELQQSLYDTAYAHVYARQWKRAEEREAEHWWRRSVTMARLRKKWVRNEWNGVHAQTNPSSLKPLRNPEAMKALLKEELAHLKDQQVRGVDTLLDQLDLIEETQLQQELMEPLVDGQWPDWKATIKDDLDVRDDIREAIEESEGVRSDDDLLEAGEGKDKVTKVEDASVLSVDAVVAPTPSTELTTDPTEEDEDVEEVMREIFQEMGLSTDVIPDAADDAEEEEEDREWLSSTTSEIIAELKSMAPPGAPDISADDPRVAEELMERKIDRVIDSPYATDFLRMMLRHRILDYDEVEDGPQPGEEEEEGEAEEWDEGAQVGVEGEKEGEEGEFEAKGEEEEEGDAVVTYEDGTEVPMLEDIERQLEATPDVPLLELLSQYGLEAEEMEEWMNEELLERIAARSAETGEGVDGPYDSIELTEDGVVEGEPYYTLVPGEEERVEAEIEHEQLRLLKEWVEYHKKAAQREEGEVQEEKGEDPIVRREEHRRRLERRLTHLFNYKGGK